MHTKEEKEDYRVAREHVKDHLYQKIAVNVGNPGDMITGNAFVVFSSDHARDVICELADEDVKESVKNKSYKSANKVWAIV